jgi:hypothetical protein
MLPQPSFRPGTTVEVRLRRFDDWCSAVVIRPAPGGALVMVSGSTVFASADGLGPQIRRPENAAAA